MKQPVSPSRSLIAILAAALAFQAPLAQAGIVTTEEAASQKQPEDDRAKVQRFLEKANVKERLQALGVDGILAQERVAALSQEEVHALAQRIDSMPAGGALSTTDMLLIVLAVVLVIIIL